MFGSTENDSEIVCKKCDYCDDCYEYGIMNAFENLEDFLMDKNLLYFSGLSAA
jgi:hypothetical protein